jgi:Cu/Ag efflux protein CusF
MIKRISILVFACLIVAAFSFAADTPSTAATTKAPSKSAMKSDLEKVSGTVEKMDSKTHTVTVNTGTESKAFTTGSKTVYMQSGKKVKSTTLKEGDKVSVWSDSKNMAHKIEIEPASASH